MFVEPLLICPNSDYINLWQHPEIVELTKDLKMFLPNTLRGNLLRVDLSFDDDRMVHIVCITDNPGMIGFMSADHMPDYLSRMAILLTQPVWAPGGKNFVDTEFGMIFNRIYSMEDEDFDVAVTTEVSLVYDEESWWFDL